MGSYNMARDHLGGPFPANFMYFGVMPSLLPADPQVSFGSLVSVADKQVKMQNNLAKAGSSRKSHLSRCADQLLRVALCEVRSIFLSQYSLATHRCVCWKAEIVDFPQDFAHSGPSYNLFRINFLGSAGRQCGTSDPETLRVRVRI